MEGAAVSSEQVERSAVIKSGNTETGSSVEVPETISQDCSSHSHNAESGQVSSGSTDNNVSNFFYGNRNPILCNRAKKAIPGLSHTSGPECTAIECYWCTRSESPSAEEVNTALRDWTARNKHIQQMKKQTAELAATITEGKPTTTTTK